MCGLMSLGNKRAVPHAALTASSSRRARQAPMPLSETAMLEAYFPEVRPVADEGKAPIES